MKIYIKNNEFILSFLGDLIGTLILVFFGCGSIAVIILFSSHSGLFQIAAIWGVSVALAIYATRHISCAHLNPAVSIAMVVTGRMAARNCSPICLGNSPEHFWLQYFCTYCFQVLSPSTRISMKSSKVV